MSNAPYCPTSHDQPKGVTHQQRGAVDIAAIPPVHNLREVITAINAINNVVQHITRGAPQVNNLYIPKAQPQPDGTRPPPFNYANLRWREVHRDYRDTQRVVNPDDKTQFVKLKMITRIKWLEDNTEHQLVYMGMGGPIGPGRM